MAMKKILIAAISINGMIAENSGQLVDWTSKEDKIFFKEKTRDSGVVVFGNNTFRTFGGNPLPERLNVVMTKNLGITSEYHGQNEGVWYTGESPHGLIEILENSGKYETCFICGGSQIYSLFLNAGLIDEFMVTIEPIVIGCGLNLFSEFQSKISLKLLEKKFINKDSIMLHYKLLKD